MALDISVLGAFKPVFMFLLTFVIVYGLLTYAKVFQTKPNLNAVLAFVAGIIVLFSGRAGLVIEIMTPWFLVFVIFLFFTFFIVRMFGISDADLTKGFKTNGTIHAVIIVIAMLIAVGSFSAAFGQKLLSDNPQVASQPSPVPTNVSGYANYPGGVPPVADVASGNIPLQRTGDGSTASPSFGQNVLNTLVHPKVLGMFFLLLIGVFTMVFLSKPNH
ncbi:MAG: hypothetical protein ABIA93_01715 [Candidatus Woesearchaeota archaeon]